MDINADIMELVRGGKLALPPVVVTVVEPGGQAGGDAGGAADYVDVQWEGQRSRFVVEAQRLATPRAIQQAVASVKAVASPPETYPMIVVPYLAPARLEELQAAGVSGLDLCGNGVIVVPGRMLVFRTGMPNRFPQSAKLRNVYRGKNSLVARAFLIRPRFAQVKEIVALLAERQGGVTFSTVTKVLQRLEDDLVVSRDEGRRGEGAIRLIQADTLMEKLAANYEPPVIVERFRGKCDLSREELARRLAVAATAASGQLVLTGEASTEKFAVFAGEPVTYIYCTDSPARLLNAAGIDAKETDRFVNVELLRTADARVYFDARDDNGVPFASPIQTWLELATGDKRQKDAAEQVKQGLLESLNNV